MIFDMSLKARTGETKRIDVKMIIAPNELKNGARSRRRKR